MNHTEMGLQLNTLAIFRNILKDPVIRDLQELLRSLDRSRELPDAVTAYGAFTASLYASGGNLTDHIENLVLNDENIAVKTTARGLQLPACIAEALENELRLLDSVSKLTAEPIISGIDYKGFLPAWETSPTDLTAKYRERLATLPEHGYGVLAEYRCFILKDEGLTPVKYPDTQSMEQLFGYERERDLVDKNTLALIEGRGCSNVLLYGDAGTGKSSTIKAVANKYADRGLRLVEVKKNQLYRMPDVLEELSASPLKFIIFIDDLSFSSNDDNFSALKAILEGGVSSAGDNVAIYATSNRRHLVKERMEDRIGDELHKNDTLQETMSLAARFGLTITFQQPSKDEYLYLVDELAEMYGLDMDKADLHLEAEKYALRQNGRSPRAAKNCVELLKSGLRS